MPDIIWLNGASSSGKTTLARALQSNLNEIYLHVQLDTFIDMLPQRIQHDRKRLEEHIQYIISPFHRSVRDLAVTGNKLIVDHVFENRNWLIECLGLMSDISVLFVGLHSPLEELRRREMERGNRVLGLAEWHANSIHRGINYDINLNTSMKTVDECVEEIQKYLIGNTTPLAFKSLKENNVHSD